MVRADCEVALKLCDEAVLSLEAELKTKEEIDQKQNEFIKELIKQRNEAYEELAKRPETGWENGIVKIGLGAAAATTIAGSDSTEGRLLGLSFGVIALIIEAID